MKITYCDTKICAKEVHSDVYEEKLRFLKLLKDLGYVYSIEKHYSETGWVLIGYADSFKEKGYYYTGEWDKESD